MGLSQEPGHVRDRHEYCIIEHGTREVKLELPSRAVAGRTRHGKRTQRARLMRNLIDHALEFRAQRSPILEARLPSGTSMSETADPTDRSDPTDQSYPSHQSHPSHQT
jgi:hypothetical protein